ncbi:MAG: glutathione S-transferase [Burkholderiales bacterium]|nr:glutathione S-transferase [Burkholderiales bacterium]
MKEHVLYGSRGSGSAAAELGLRACKVPYRVVRASNWETDSAVEELAKVNPLRQIPTLVLPDGTVMSESAAILLHLGLAHPGSGLLPEGESERARVLRGLVYIPANCYVAITVIDYPERFTVSQEKGAQEDVRQAARQYLHRNWDVFADMFEGTPYLTGGQPGALDFLAAVVSRWSGTRAHLEKSRPALFATLQRIEAHPQVAAVFREHWDA